ncbi:MAG: hypothetical protein QM724_11735 [Flavobacteriales bacterium]
MLTGLFGGLLGATAAFAQNPTSIDIDLAAGSAANTLDVKVRANGQAFSDVVSSLTFTLRWPASSPATLGTATQYCPGGYFLAPSGQVSSTVGGVAYNYMTYSAFGNARIALACSDQNWAAGTWRTVLTIPVDGITACTAFNIVNDAYATANNRKFFVALNGFDKTGALGGTTVNLGNCTADCLGVVGGTALPGTSCNDNDPNTTNDTWSTSCVCSGTVPCTAPVAGGITSNSPICSGGTLSLSVNPAGTAPLSYAWTGTGTFSPNRTSRSVTVSGAASGTYSVTVSNACGQSTANVTVAVNSPANAGTNGTLLICSNGAPVSLLSRLGGSPQANGTWSGPSTVTGGNYNPATMDPGVYTYTVTGTAPCPNASATVTVTENAAPNAGTNGTLAICSNGTSVSLFSRLGGSPQSGGTWSGPSTVTGGTYNPATMDPGNYVYTVTGTSPCANATATVVVTENAAPNAGTNGTLAICSNGTSVSLFSRLGGSPQSGGTWSGPSTVTGGTYNPATMDPGNYVYTVTGTSPCANATATVVVTENAAPNAGTNGTLAICSNGAPVSLLGRLGGSPQANGTWSGPSTVTGGNYNPATMDPGNYVYTVTGTSPCVNATATVVVTENAAPNAGTNGTLAICSNGAPVSLLGRLGGTPQANGTWSGPSTVTGGNYNPATMDPGNYVYTVTGTSPCVNATTTVVVTENAAPNAGTNGTLQICSNGAPVSLLGRLGGSPQANGTWSGPSTVTGGTYNPVTMDPGNYVYTVTGTSPCLNATATVVVTKNAAPNAGTNGTLQICSNGAPVSLLGRLGGSPQANGTWSGPSTVTGGTYNPATMDPGNYVYTVVGTSPCVNATATVVVTENAAPNAGMNGTLAICSSGAATNLLAQLGGSPQANGTWSGPSPVNNNLYDPVTMFPGTYTYTVTGVSPCVNASATVSVTESATATWYRDLDGDGAGRSGCVDAVLHTAERLCEQQQRPMPCRWQQDGARPVRLRCPGYGQRWRWHGRLQ